MTIQELFDAITREGKTVSLTLGTRNEFETLRTGLLRKYSRYVAECSSVGIDMYDDKYLSSTYSKQDQQAIFMLANKDQQKRKSKSYVATLI
jgi:hypothetical protein